MSKIEIKNVYKIFGSNPETVLPIVKEGASKEEVCLSSIVWFWNIDYFKRRTKKCFSMVTYSI